MIRLVRDDFDALRKPYSEQRNRWRDFAPDLLVGIAERGRSRSSRAQRSRRPPKHLSKTR